MKRILVLSICFHIMYATLAFAQLTVDAGRDTTYCFPKSADAFVLAPHIKVSNAVGPISVAWQCEVKLTERLQYWASDFLLDTTALSPKLANFNSFNRWTPFIVTVTDAENNSASDTLRVRISRFTYPTGYPFLTIQRGDSVRLSGYGVSGGIPPFTYTYTPNRFITKHADAYWVKPEQSMVYLSYATDSCACQSEARPVLNVKVEPEIANLEVYDRQFVDPNPRAVDTTMFWYRDDTLYIRNINSNFCCVEGMAASSIRKGDSLIIDVFPTSTRGCLMSCSYGYSLKVKTAQFNKLTVQINEFPRSPSFIEEFNLDFKQLTGFTKPFAKVGATWYYDYHTVEPGYLSCQTWKCVADTFIKGQACSKIQISKPFSQNTFVYMNTRNDSVFFYANGNFNLLYDWGAEKGDTVVLDYFSAQNPGGKLLMIVDSLGTIDINGEIRKAQYVTSGDGLNTEFGGLIVQGIGNLGFMFPRYDNDANGALRCYEDEQLGLFKVRRLDKDCEAEFAPFLYQRVISGNIKWNFVRGFCDASSMEYLQAEMDSTVEQLRYATLRDSKSTKLGNLVEDYEHGTIRFMNDSFPEGYLIFDMSLEEGDAFKIGKHDLIVEKTYRKYGRKHICFNEAIRFCGEISDSLKFIEGIGPNFLYIPFYHSLTIENSYLLCASYNEETMYNSNVFDGECYVDWTNLNEKERVKINVFSVRNTIQINNQMGTGYIELYNLLGQKIKEQRLEMGKSQMDVHALANQIIIYRIYMGKQQFADKVMVR